MPTKTAKAKIERLEPETVAAPLLVRTPFKILGEGLSSDMKVYVSTEKDGSDEVSEIEIKFDDSSPATDKVLSLIATPAMNSPTDKDLWVVVTLDDDIVAVVPKFRPTEVTIDRLDPTSGPEPVVAPLLVRTPFKMIGKGLDRILYFYLSTKADGSDDVSNPDGSTDPSTYKVRIDPDTSSPSTDRVRSLVALAQLSATNTNQLLWLAVKLNDVNGRFVGARKAFMIV